MTSWNTLSTISAKTERARDIIRRYGENGLQFLELFNPSMQTEYTLDVKRAYRGHAPALSGVKEAYGGGTARSWLVIQINNLAEFSGCKEKLSIEKIEELVNIILNEYGYLKLTELMDFFRKFKAGNYGKFYGTVDPMVITCALVEFMRERSIILNRLARQEYEEKKWRDPEYVSWRRCMETDRKRRIFYARNFASPDFSYEEFKEIWWLFCMGYERADHGYINE